MNEKWLLRIFAAMTLALILCMVMATVLRTKEAKDSTVEIIDSGNIHVFQTKNSDEYLSFLQDANKNGYKIINVSTSMRTGTYTNGEFYIVTYQSGNDDIMENSGEVKIFRTEKIEEYLEFLQNLDESNIIGITTCMRTGTYSSYPFYIVTYRE